MKVNFSPVAQSLLTLRFVFNPYHKTFFHLNAFIKDRDFAHINFIWLKVARFQSQETLQWTPLSESKPSLSESKPLLSESKPSLSKSKSPLSESKNSLSETKYKRSDSQSSRRTSTRKRSGFMGGGNGYFSVIKKLSFYRLEREFCYVDCSKGDFEQRSWEE